MLIYVVALIGLFHEAFFRKHQRLKRLGANAFKLRGLVFLKTKPHFILIAI